MLEFKGISSAEVVNGQLTLLANSFALAILWLKITSILIPFSKKDSLKCVATLPEPKIEMLIFEFN